jgi:hypothetical protein
MKIAAVGLSVALVATMCFAGGISAFASSSTTEPTKDTTQENAPFG